MDFALLFLRDQRRLASCQPIWTILRLDDQFVKSNSHFRVKSCKFVPPEVAKFI